MLLYLDQVLWLVTMVDLHQECVDFKSGLMTRAKAICSLPPED